jgi:hypothetical protein
MNWLRVLVVPLLGLALLSGCFKATVKGPRTVYPSPAEEVRDLKRARDAGAITPEEYQSLLRKLAPPSQPAGKPEGK